MRPMPAENGPDLVRTKLLNLVKERPDLDLKKLSLRLGYNHSYLYHFIHKGSPRELRERDRVTLASIFGIPDSELAAHPIQSTMPRHAQAAFAAAGMSEGLGPVLSPQRDLPILGYAKGGENAFFIGNGEVSGYTIRPQILMGVREAYAVEFWDSSMEPAFKHGHLGWVHPRTPVSPGDDVVVQLTDGQALAKTLVRRTEKAIILKQYNPPKEIRLDTQKVKSIHLIVGSLRVRT